MYSVRLNGNRLRDLRRRLHDYTFSRTFARTIGLLTFASLILATEVVHRAHVRQTRAEDRAEALSYASNLLAHAERELTTTLALSRSLSSYLEVNQGETRTAEFNTLMANLFATSRHLRRFTIAVGHRVANVYPRTGNEHLIGSNYAENPAVWEYVKHAISTGQGTLVGPGELVKGHGFAYRLPVFIRDQYWGMISSAIDAESFYAAAFDEIRSDRFEFAIRGKDGLGERGEVFLGNPALFSDPKAVRLESVVPNGKWIYAVRVKPASGFSLSIDGALRIMSWLLAVALGLTTATVLRQRSELARLAGHDNLTGLPNRQQLDVHLKRAVSAHARDASRQVGALFIDLDNFKEINDTQGHASGDIALQVAAERIRAEIRNSDTLARWGGDEFVAVIEQANEAMLEQLAERLIARIEQPFDAFGVTLRMSASIGRALLPAASATPQALLELADRHMYEEKQRRKTDCS